MFGERGSFFTLSVAGKPGWGTLLSRVGFFMGPLVEGDHDPSLGEFPCARACVGAGDALGRAEEEEPLLEDVAQPRGGVGSRKRWGVRMALALAYQGAGGDHRANAAEGLFLFASPRDSGFGPGSSGSPGFLWTLLELLVVVSRVRSG